jgi:hypothetical protein
MSLVRLSANFLVTTETTSITTVVLPLARKKMDGLVRKLLPPLRAFVIVCPSCYFPPSSSWLVLSRPRPCLLFVLLLLALVVRSPSSSLFVLHALVALVLLYVNKYTVVCGDGIIVSNPGAPPTGQLWEQWYAPPPFVILTI